MNTTQCLYTEPTSPEIRQHLLDRRIRPNDVWLAAFLGSKSAQAVLECRGIERGLAAINPRVIGSVIQSFDGDYQTTRRIALIIAKHVLPAWQKRFPNDALGHDIVSAIIRAIKYMPTDTEYDRLSAKIGYGSHGSFHESAALSAMLKLVHDPDAHFCFGDSMHQLGLGEHELIALIGKELIPWLLDRQEISAPV